jgi:hypothetical protein
VPHSVTGGDNQGREAETPKATSTLDLSWLHGAKNGKEFIMGLRSQKTGKREGLKNRSNPEMGAKIGRH